MLPRGEGLNALMSLAPRLNAQRDLVGNANPITFECHNFLWVIRQHPNVLQPEINQYLRANSALMLHHALARWLTIKLSAGVQVNLGQRSRLVRLLDTKPAPSVMQIQENSAPARQRM